MSRAERRRQQRAEEASKSVVDSFKMTVKQMMQTHPNMSMADFNDLVYEGARTRLYREVYNEVSQNIILSMVCAQVIAVHKIFPSWVSVTAEGKKGMLWRLLEDTHNVFLEQEKIFAEQGMQAVLDGVYKECGIELSYSPVGNGVSAEVNKEI